jgi:hypothetical protein
MARINGRPRFPAAAQFDRRFEAEAVAEAGSSKLAAR